MTDIGWNYGIAEPSAGSSLVCVTANVNTHCCRDVDGGRVGNWFFPNGTIVPHYSNSSNYVISRTAFTQQVRLDSRSGIILPIGVYTCKVPDGRNGSVIHTANISLTLKGKNINFFLKFECCLLFVQALLFLALDCILCSKAQCIYLVLLFTLMT